MKAVQIRSYGGSENLRIEEVPRPKIRAAQVLVRIHDAGVNPVDWKIREGTMQKAQPANFPLTMGQDFAGEVVEVGGDVKGFRAGDRVFGFASGSYAEFAAVSPQKITRIPEGMGYALAASIPTAGVTAYQIITKEVRPGRGSRILIHGAAGGVGSFAVQIARHLGAAVIANAAKGDEKYLWSLGVEQVIDYEAERFEEIVKDLDAVVDLVGGDVCDRSYPLVKRGGVLLSTVGAASEEKGRQYGIRAISFVMESNAADLSALAQLVESEAVKPRLDKVLPFTEAKSAQDINQRGASHGKVVLEIVR